MSVRRNADDAGVELEILVGLDEGAGRLPKGFTTCLAPATSENECELEAGHAGPIHRCGDEEWPVGPKGSGKPALKAAYATGKGQAQAVNAAAKLITGDFVAMIEDDDQWRPSKLAVQLDVLSKGYQFCSSTQREIDEFGNFLRTNAFACPSSWLMPRETWEAVGPFDETFKYHVDTEWLGRLNRVCKERGWKRAHIAHTGAETDGCWIDQVRRFSDIGHDDELPEPLVDRTVHEGSGMASIREDGERLKRLFEARGIAHSNYQANQEAFNDFALKTSPETPYGHSVREHVTMFQRYGRADW